MSELEGRAGRETVVDEKDGLPLEARGRAPDVELPVEENCPPSRFDSKAIFVPSGDQTGSLSRTVLRVSLRSPLPSAFIIRAPSM